MFSVALGPFAISVERLLIIGAFAVALLAGWLLGRRSQHHVESDLTLMLVSGFIAARICFVVMYLDDYLIEPMSIVDIRDGGFYLPGGVIVALLVGTWRSWRSQHQFKTLASAALAGVVVWSAGTLLFTRSSESYPGLPPIELVTLTGESVNLQSLNDRPLVINLWATWCLPCRREMPVLEAAQKRDSHVRYVFINQAESAEIIADYLADEDLQLENILLDATAVSGRLLETRGLPSTYFFDANGQMLDMHVGELSRATLNRQLRQLR